MARTRPSYPPDFKEEAIRIVRSFNMHWPVPKNPVWQPSAIERITVTSVRYASTHISQRQLILAPGALRYTSGAGAAI